LPLIIKKTLIYDGYRSLDKKQKILNLLKRRILILDGGRERSCSGRECRPVSVRRCGVWKTPRRLRISIGLIRRQVRISSITCAFGANPIKSFGHTALTNVKEINKQLVVLRGVP